MDKKFGKMSNFLRGSRDSTRALNQQKMLDFLEYTLQYFYSSWRKCRRNRAENPTSPAEVFNAA